MYFFNFDLNQPSIDTIKVGKETLEKLAVLDRQFDPKPWPLNTWLNLPDLDFEAVFTLSQGLEVLGFAIFRLSFEEGLSHLLKLLIIPARRREGLGELVLLRAMEILKGLKVGKLYLEVEKGNPAFFLYSKIGLSKIHEIADFYGPDRPGLVMVSNA